MRHVPHSLSPPLLLSFGEELVSYEISSSEALAMRAAHSISGGVGGSGKTTRRRRRTFASPTKSRRFLLKDEDEGGISLHFSMKGGSEDNGIGGKEGGNEGGDDFKTRARQARSEPEPRADASMNELVSEMSALKTQMETIMSEAEPEKDVKMMSVTEARRRRRRRRTFDGRRPPPKVVEVGGEKAEEVGKVSPTRVNFMDSGGIKLPGIGKGRKGEEGEDLPRAGPLLRAKTTRGEMEEEEKDKALRSQSMDVVGAVMV